MVNQDETWRLNVAFYHRLDEESIWSVLNGWAEGHEDIRHVGLNRDACTQLGSLYPRYTPESVAAVWDYFWNNGGCNNPAQCLRQLNAVLSPANPGKRGIELAQSLLKDFAKFNRQTQVAMVVAAAELAQRAGDLHLADRAYDVYLAMSPDHSQELLDCQLKPGLDYLERGQFLRAAKCFEQSRRDRDEYHALSLYLNALALEKAGQLGNAERLYRMARLADDASNQLVLQLWERGLVDAARREYQREPQRFLSRRIYGYEPSDVVQFLASLGEFDKAAEYVQRIIAAMPAPDDCGPVSAWLAMTLVGQYRALKARHHFTAGRVDAGWAEAKRCLNLLPASVEHGSRFVVALDRLNQRDLATSVYQDVLDRHTKQLALFPNSAWLHARVAWLCASTGREPQRALKHAREAVKLAPRWDQAHLALAEALWASGERRQARQVVREALETTYSREPNSRIFAREQLRRYQSEQPGEPAEGFEELL